MSCNAVTTREHRLYLGKCDYNNSGRKNCKAFITWKLENGRFSMSAEIWNPCESDCYMCGQCVGAVAKYFPRNLIARRMVEVWCEWHLNDLTAGSPAQRAFLKSNPVVFTYPETHYGKACAMLAAAGLSPDPEHVRDGKPYKYGSAWLMRELPADVIAEIESWSALESGI